MSNLESPPEVVVTACDSRLAVFARMTDPHVLAEMLCTVLGERPLDAIIVARHTPGILPNTMTAAQADRLVELLRGLGVHAARVAGQDLPDMVQPTVIHHARCREVGWELVDLYGTPMEVVPWSQVTVIAVGAVPGDVVHRYAEQGRPSILSAAPMPETGSVNRADTAAYELWVLRRSPTTAYRIDHRRFNYEALGGAKTESATANFEHMVKTLVEHATAARRTPSTHAFLAHDLRSKYDFASSGDLQQQALLHWVIGLDSQDASVGH